MGNFRLGRAHRGLGVIIGMHMLLNMSLISCRGKLTVLAFLLGLARRYFFKLNLRLRILKTYFSNLMLLTSTSLGVFFMVAFTKKTKKSYIQQYLPKDSRQPQDALAAKTPK